MILSKLFPPKWKHKSPQVRKRTLLALDTKTNTSQTIYVDDPELFIRRIALQRITDIDQIQVFRNSNADKEIYEEATKRLCELLSGCSDFYTVDQLLERLQKNTEYRVFEYVARYARNDRLQKFAIEKIDSDTVLVDVIANTDSPENVRLALRKLKSVNALKNVVKQFKRKDKSIVALAQEKIDKISAQLEGEKSAITQYRRVAKDFQELFHLCKLSGEWEKYNIRLRSLYDQLRGLAVTHNLTVLAGDKELADTIEQSYQYFERQLIQQLSNKTKSVNWGADLVSGVDQTLSEMRLLTDKLDSELKELDKLELSDIDKAQKKFKQLIEESKKQWNKLCNEISDSVFNDKQETEFQRVNTVFKAAELQLSNALANVDELEAFKVSLDKLLEEADRLVRTEEAIERKKLDMIIAKFDGIQYPELIKIAQPLVEAAKQTRRTLIEKSDLIEQQSQQSAEELRLLNTELQQAIDQGRSRHASHLINRGRKIIKLVSNQHKKALDHEGVTARFNNLAQMANDLKDWRQWSSGSVKEQLIDKIQKLADEVDKNKQEPDFDFESVANTIKTARSDWQALQVGEPKSEGNDLWSEFNDACNRAYEPCQKYFDRLNRQRDANFQLRESICADLERYLEKISQADADAIDWSALSKIMRTARQDWKQMGETRRGDWEKVNVRFNTALKALQKLLQEQQMLNRDAKMALICQAEALLKNLSDNAIDVDQAINSVRQIQVKWKSIGIAPKDKQLWGQFKQLCDEIYAVRSSEQQRINQEKEQLQQQRLEIIDSILKLASVSENEILQAKPNMNELVSRWKELPELKHNNAMQRRFEKALDEFNAALEQQQRNEVKVLKKLLRSNVELAYELERRIFEYYSGSVSNDQLVEVVENLRSQWHQIDYKKLEIAGEVSAWFERLAGYVDKINLGARAEIEQGVLAQQQSTENNKEIICIQMEILAGVESPDSSKQRRMEFQVAQLATHMMRSDKVEKQDRINDLLSQWYQSGPIAPGKAKLFEQRLYSALCLLDKEYQ